MIRFLCVLVWLAELKIPSFINTSLYSIQTASSEWTRIKNIQHDDNTMMLMLKLDDIMIMVFPCFLFNLFVKYKPQREGRNELIISGGRNRPFYLGWWKLFVGFSIYISYNSRWWVNMKTLKPHFLTPFTKD